MSGRVRAAALACLGLLLVSAPLWLYPAGGQPTYVYDATAVTPQDPSTVAPAMQGSDGVLRCPDDSLGNRTRRCALELAVLQRDGVVVADTAGVPRRDYGVVRLTTGEDPPVARTYRPTSRDLGESARLGLERIDLAEAISLLAVDRERAPAGVRRAVREGEYETEEPLDDAPVLVADGGDYVLVERRSHDPGDPPAMVGLAKPVAVAVGALALVAAGRRLA